MQGPVPLHDPEAEASLIASIAGDPWSHQQTLRDADPAWFFLREHRATLEAMQHLDTDGAEINLITLKAELERAGKLNLVRGLVGLSEILASAEVGRPHVLAELIQDRAKRRQIIREADKAQRSAGDPTIPLGDIVDGLKALIHQAPSSRHEVLALHDPAQWTVETPSPVRFLLDGLLPLGAPAMLAGKPNCGKSLQAMQLSVAVAAGRGIFGRRGPDAPVGVLFVELEDAPEEMHRRFRRCLDLFREDPTWTAEDEVVVLRNWRAAFPDWEVTGARTLPALVPWLIEQAKGIPNLGLVVLDTFAALSDGPENDAEAHKGFWSAAYSLAAMTGATPLILHHSRKALGGAARSQTLGERLSFDQLRGSSAIVAGARAILQAEALTPAEAGKADLDEDRAETGNLVVLALTKQNAGPKGEWLLLEQRQAGETGAGFFTVMPGGDRILALLRSKAAVAKLGKAEAILLDVAAGVVDHQALTRRHYPDDPRADSKLKTQLRDLRNRHRWLQARSMDLTAQGFAKVQELRGGQTGECAHQVGNFNEEYSASA